MADTSLSRLWIMRVLFALLALGVIFFQLLPLETTPRRWAGPDLVMALAFCWVLRRPEYVPLSLVAVLLLLSDLLLGRPPGLWAALTLIAFDYLGNRAPRLRDMPFLVEWVTVTLAMTAVMLGYRLVLAVFLVEDGPLGMMLIRLAATVLCYPLVVAFSRFGLRLRKAALGEVNALGQRQ